MAIQIHNIKVPEGSNKGKKRVGRGPGSGHGKTAARGYKGQKSRSGYSSRPGFEGGQMPLQRRLPKRGFTNIFKKVWVEVKLADLVARFDGSVEITPDLLSEQGIIRKSSLAKSDGLVVLGQGEVSKPLKITAHRFTTSAREKIEAAGGKATVIEKGGGVKSKE